MVYNFFDKKSKGSRVNIPLDFNEELAKELHQPIIRKFSKRTVYSGFNDNIWGADLADMQLISKFNKYAWVVPLKDKKVLQLLMLFKKYWNNLIENQTKYGFTKEVNLTTVILKNG